MKKLFLSTFAVAMIATASNAQIRFGAEVGLNMANVVSSPSITTSTAMGARVGAIMDYAINDKISIQPGIMFSMMGYKMDPVTVHLNYIHIPINVLYKFEVGPGKLFVGVNPYLSYGASISVSEGTAPKFGSGDQDVKALDFGIGGQVGYELPMGLLFRVGYDYGLANLSNTSGQTVNNTDFHISVGYLFGSK